MLLYSNLYKIRLFGNPGALCTVDPDGLNSPDGLDIMLLTPSLNSRDNGASNTKSKLPRQ